MPLSWNEIKDRALKFSKNWDDAKDEKSEAQRFWIDFFDIFGFTKQHVFAFEHAINKQGSSYKGNHGWIDLLWPAKESDPCPCSKHPVPAFLRPAANRSCES